MSTNTQHIAVLRTANVRPLDNEGLPRSLKIWLILYLVPVVLFVVVFISALVVCS